MQNPSSPLDTLRQLKEMLDAGALTPTEFEALKQRLVFSPEPPAPTAAVPPPDISAAELPVTLSAPPAAEQHSPMFEDVAAAETAPTPVVAPAANSFSASEPNPIGPPTPEPEPLPNWAADEFPAPEAPPARNPLALLLSIGGLLALLGLVLYLSLNRPPSEHISSTSQTAADSLANPIETGPQAVPLPPTTSVPETVRLAPTHPAPPISARTPVARDSAAVSPPAVPADSAAGQ